MYKNKFSCIVPIYNSEKTIGNCLDSIINQNYDNLEIICIDDLSQDRSVSIINEYRKKDSRIILLKNEKNIGAGYSRNVGIKHSTGDYIHFIDSDDKVFNCNCYEEVNKIININNNPNILKFRSKTYDYTTDEYIKFEYFEQNEKYTKTKVFSCLNHDDLNIVLKLNVSPWSNIIKRDFLINNQIYFNNLKCCNDRFFNIKLLICGNNIVAVDLYIIHYRINKKNSLLDIRNENFSNMIESFCEIQNLLLEKNIDNHRKDLILSTELRDILLFWDKYTTENKYIDNSWRKSFDFSTMDSVVIYLNNDFNQIFISFKLNLIFEKQIKAIIYKLFDYIGKKNTIEMISNLVDKSLWKKNQIEAMIKCLARSDLFDSCKYLDSYNDVSSQNIDPITHYVKFGLLENRKFKLKERSSRRDKVNINICPKISVVIPVYNNSIYLKECFDSVLNQTYKNIEVIIVNDGSTEAEAIRIINIYKNKDNRVNVINKDNTGYGNTMNVGINASSGDYLCIVESDDFIKNDMIEKLLNIMLQKKVDIVKSCQSEFSEIEGKKKIRYIPLTMNEYLYNKILSPIDSYEIFRMPILNQCCMFNMDFIKKNNIKFNETPGASFQDNSFHFQTFSLTKRIYFIKDSFYMHREDNPNSSINRKDKVFCTDDEFRFIKNFLCKNGIYCKFKELFTLRKFRSFIFTLSRISQDFKYIYKQYLKKDILRSIKNNELDVKMFDERELNTLADIINSKNIYYKTENIINSKFVKISIIMPIYNSEKHLNEALDSALSQTLKDIEIICINDGSHDSSRDILTKYFKHDKRIRIIDKINSGAANSRNLGLKFARGKFVSFLDSDDLYAKETTLEMLYEMANENKVSISGGCIYSYPEKIYSNKSNFGCKKNGIHFYNEIQFDYGFQAYIYEKLLLERFSIGFPDLQRYEDPCFYVRSMFYSEKFYYVNENVYNYRWVNKELSQLAIKDTIIGISDILKFSKIKNLTKLYLLSLERLYFDYYDRIKSKLNHEIIELLKNIDINFIYKYCDISKFNKIKDRSISILSV